MEGVGWMYVGQLWTASSNLFYDFVLWEREKKWGLVQKENEECLREDDSTDENKEGGGEGGKKDESVASCV